MRIVSELLAPGGIVMISLRHGPDLAGRFHRVSADELIQHAHNRALIKQHDVRGVPDLTRQEIHWDYLLFQLPDDGTGSLPLLRHIIVNDNKTASYKLGLLRTLVRIAEGYPGMVTRRTDDRVEIPFGLVGLFWLKIYMPLVLTHNLIQTPKADHAKQTGYGWAKAEHFYSLQDLSSFDLRVGATFYGDTARRLIGTIRDACMNIKKNPAHFTTYPGSDDFVFNCEMTGFRYNSKNWRITRESLQKFGTFSIPLDLWQSFSQYGCWIEPAINNEWVRLMQSWNSQYEISIYDRALRWEQGPRSTTVPNQRIQLLLQRGESVSCVWTQKNLARQKYAVDHCFPWSRWLNNDLWNLMPATAVANNAKSDKLPSAALLQHSRRPIVDWWERAYEQDELLEQQFFIEAEAALPLLGGEDRSLDAVFHAMEYQRT